VNTTHKPMRLCLVADDVRHPLDEGFKKAITSMIGCLQQRHESLVVGRNIEAEIGKTVTQNRLLLSARLARAIRVFRPDIVIYFPMASITVGSFVRSRILRLYSGVPTAMVGLQPRTYGPLARRMVAALSPDIVFVQSWRSVAVLQGLGMRAGYLPSGVDLARFQPAPSEKRVALRIKHGLPTNRKILLHVGHLNRDRGIDLLAMLASSSLLPLLVTSTSTVPDEGFRRELEEKGVRIVTRYLPDIEELYQLADVYLFPTYHVTSAIEFPLSVLEALACGIPVLSTRFGALDTYFDSNSWFRFFASREEARVGLGALLACGEHARPAIRKAVETRFSWDAVCASLLNQCVLDHVAK